LWRPPPAPPPRRPPPPPTPLCGHGGIFGGRRARGRAGHGSRRRPPPSSRRRRLSSPVLRSSAPSPRAGRAGARFGARPLDSGLGSLELAGSGHAVELAEPAPSTPPLLAARWRMTSSVAMEAGGRGRAPLHYADCGGGDGRWRGSGDDGLRR
jgi:hypothetical protein